jgi:hypothetical protein
MSLTTRSSQKTKAPKYNTTHVHVLNNTTECQLEIASQFCIENILKHAQFQKTDTSPSQQQRGLQAVAQHF